jgi:hypothetical protein
MGPFFSHGFRMTCKTYLPDLRYARRPVGFEHQPKQFGHEVIEFFACAWIWEFAAFSTSL